MSRNGSKAKKEGVESQGLLEGIRIIEMGVWEVAPLASMLLADLGAEVIKIEQPEGGDQIRGMTHTLGGIPVQLPGGRQANFEFFNRNKKGIVLNLKEQKGKEVLARLITKSDVFLTNLSMRSMNKLGLTYQIISQHNPEIIFAYSTSLGERGPDADSPGFDLMTQAASGVMMSSGEYHMPPVQNSEGMADGVGGLSLAFGVLAALLGRERLGIGQEVASSQLGALILLESYIINTALQVSGEFKRTDRTQRTNPLYCWYKCKDGKWIVLATLQSDKYWPTFCEAIGKPQLVEDSRFKTSMDRRKNCKTLISVLDDIFITRVQKEWISVFEGTDIMFSPVKDITDILHDPQVIENEYIVDFEHQDLGRMKFPGYPVHFSRTPPSIRSAAPNLGEHTYEVLLRTCGYKDDEIAKLFEEGIV